MATYAAIRAAAACFVAGTLVQTDRGLVPIETLKVGDMVLSRSEFLPDSASEYKPVDFAMCKTEKIFELRTNSSSLFATAEHHSIAKQVVGPH